MSKSSRIRYVVPGDDEVLDGIDEALDRVLDGDPIRMEGGGPDGS